MSKKRIAIIGGSIAGCVSAFALHRAGCDVHVFESSPAPLVGRGASITMPLSVLQRCVEEGLIRQISAFSQMEAVNYVCLAADGISERWLGTAKVALAAASWSDLYKELRANVPDEVFQLGKPVDRVVNETNRAVLRFRSGEEESFDLAVCADGYKSIGRPLIEEGAKLRHEDSILIRGITDALGNEAFLSQATRILYPGGHGVVYVVQVSTASAVHSGRRQVSWAYYLPVDKPTATLSSSRSNDNRDDTDQVFRGDSKSDLQAKLDALRTNIPKRFFDIIERTSEIHVQSLMSVQLENHALSRVCLVGDAGSIFPPFTVSGVFKAVFNALSLSEALKSSDDLVEAVTKWNHEQTGSEIKLRKDYERFAKYLIYEVPDLRNVSLSVSNTFLKRLHPDLDLDLPWEG